MYLTDASQLPLKNSGPSRAVIIGSGAVGLYASSQLVARGRQVVVIEAGNSQLSRFTPESYQSIGRYHAGIKLGRSRNLGGTTSL